MVIAVAVPTPAMAQKDRERSWLAIETLFWGNNCSTHHMIAANDAVVSAMAMKFATSDWTIDMAFSLPRRRQGRRPNATREGRTTELEPNRVPTLTRNS